MQTKGLWTTMVTLLLVPIMSTLYSVLKLHAAGETRPPR